MRPVERCRNLATKLPVGQLYSMTQLSPLSGWPRRRTDKAMMWYTLGANFASEVCPCTRIIEPYKHLLHSHILLLKLQAAMGACSGQYGNARVNLAARLSSKPSSSYQPQPQFAACSTSMLAATAPTAKTASLLVHANGVFVFTLRHTARAELPIEENILHIPISHISVVFSLIRTQIHSYPTSIFISADTPIHIYNLPPRSYHIRNHDQSTHRDVTGLTVHCNYLSLLCIHTSCSPQVTHQVVWLTTLHNWSATGWLQASTPRVLQTMSGAINTLFDIKALSQCLIHHTGQNFAQYLARKKKKKKKQTGKFR